MVILDGGVSDFMFLGSTWFCEKLGAVILRDCFGYLHGVLGQFLVEVGVEREGWSWYRRRMAASEYLRTQHLTSNLCFLPSSTLLTPLPARRLPSRPLLRAQRPLSFCADYSNRKLRGHHLMRLD